jgi:hypothetical protein
MVALQVSETLANPGVAEEIVGPASVVVLAETVPAPLVVK